MSPAGALSIPSIQGRRAAVYHPAGGPLAILTRQDHPLTRGITALPTPLAGVFNINYALAAHNRTARSPLHNWLWEQITCNIRELRTHQPRKMRQRVTAGSADSNEQ